MYLFVLCTRVQNRLWISYNAYCLNLNVMSEKEMIGFQSRLESEILQAEVLNCVKSVIKHLFQCNWTYVQIS